MHNIETLQSRVDMLSFGKCQNAASRVLKPGTIGLFEWVRSTGIDRTQRIIYYSGGGGGGVHVSLCTPPPPPGVLHKFLSPLAHLGK